MAGCILVDAALAGPVVRSPGPASGSMDGRESPAGAVDDSAGQPDAAHLLRERRTSSLRRAKRKRGSNVFLALIAAGHGGLHITPANSDDHGDANFLTGTTHA